MITEAKKHKGNELKSCIVAANNPVRFFLVIDCGGRTAEVTQTLNGTREQERGKTGELSTSFLAW